MSLNEKRNVREIRNGSRIIVTYEPDPGHAPWCLSRFIRFHLRPSKEKTGKPEDGEFLHAGSVHRQHSTQRIITDSPNYSTNRRKNPVPLRELRNLRV
jgi:hypothetical protein